MTWAFYRGGSPLLPSLGDHSDLHRLPWTRQPEGGSLHAAVVGAGPAKIVPSASIEAAKLDLLPRAASGAPARIQLREYQRECVDAVVATWTRGTRAPLAVLPTGAGKTIIAASLMERAYLSGKRSLFLAHRRELLDQTVDKIHLASSAPTPPRVGVVQASRDQLGCDVTIASAQTLRGKRLTRTLDAGPYDIVIVDEAHHAPSNEYKKLLTALREHHDIYMLGVTATPARSDGLALDTVFDEVCFQRSVFELIDLGYLVPFRACAPRLDISFETVEMDGADYDKKSLSKILNTHYVNHAMVQAWREFGEERKTLVFAVDIAHATELAREFTDAGYKAEAVYGTHKGRDAVRRRFESGETRILVNCELMIEGSDIPSIECVMFVRPTASQTMLIQQLGRGLRLHPGKSDLLALDCVGNLSRHSVIQLASLAGFDPMAPRGGRGNGHGDDDDEHGLIGSDDDGRQVTGASVLGATELDVRALRQRKYNWRETSLGWVLLIPRIGYYLVAWEGTAKKKATIRFYDQRPGREKSPAREVLTEPVSFDLAYGMVEGEMDRFFRARESRVVHGDKRGEFAAEGDDTASPWTFIELEEGLDENVDVPELLMLQDAGWRYRPTTQAQRALLLRLGGKKTSIPEHAGEASDLIGILCIERDAKTRLPPTERQLAYLRINNLGTAETRGAAARLIWPHRRERELRGKVS